MDCAAQQSSELTIIITTFNRPRMVLNAVHSALNQTLESVEGLVVDDGSDQKPELPDHPRLRLLTLEENEGVASARNAGARAARTRWITFLDDDDVESASLSRTRMATIPLGPPTWCKDVQSWISMPSAGTVAQTCVGESREPSTATTNCG